MDRTFLIMILIFRSCGGWTANDPLQDKVVEVFINVRLMMGMNSTVTKDYFEVIHTRLREYGLFVYINRYMKQVITQSKNAEINRNVDYPFDTYCKKRVYETYIHL